MKSVSAKFWTRYPQLREDREGHALLLLVDRKRTVITSNVGHWFDIVDLGWGSLQYCCASGIHYCTVLSKTRLMLLISRYSKAERWHFNNQRRYLDSRKIVSWQCQLRAHGKLHCLYSSRWISLSTFSLSPPSISPEDRCPDRYWTSIAFVLARVCRSS